MPGHLPSPSGRVSQLPGRPRGCSAYSSSLREEVTWRQTVTQIAPTVATELMFHRVASRVVQILQPPG